LGKGLLFLEMSRVIRVLIQELIINVILGSSTPRNTDRPGMVPCGSSFSYIIMRTQTLALYCSSNNLRSGSWSVRFFQWRLDTVAS
jgi:hypothetical protein